MSTFPTGKRSEFLLWAQTHAPVWEAEHAGIGLTAGQAAAFGEAVARLAEVERSLAQARQAYLAAAALAKAVYRATTREAGERVRQIRAYAATQAQPATVCNLAMIPPPAARSKAPPPATPERLAATLCATDGSLTLTWKCSNPAGTSGTSYLVWRKLPGEGAFTIRGIVGKKRFVDDALPAGVQSVEYMVQGQRADRRGHESNSLLVRIGNDVGVARVTAAARTGAAASPVGAGARGGAGVHGVPVGAGVRSAAVGAGGMIANGAAGALVMNRAAGAAGVPVGAGGAVSPGGGAARAAPG